jgi:HEAT repeat protein/AAA+ ATPase superfamily predicted ATPase
MGKAVRSHTPESKRKKKTKSGQELITLVSSDDPRKRKKAADLIKGEEHFKSENLNLLKRLIKDDSDEVWIAASCALGHLAFSNSNAKEFLFNLVDDDFPWIKRRGIYALGEYANYHHKGVERLYDLTRSQKKEIVKDAVSILGEVAEKNEYAQKALIKLLKTKEEFILKPAISSMGRLAGQDDKFLKTLRSLLEDDNNFIRLWSASAIGEAAQDNDKAFKLYLGFRDHKDVYLRRGFAQAMPGISRKRPKEAKKLISHTIDDEDRYVRTKAVASLGPLCAADKKAFAQIKTLLSQEKADVRRGAADALLDVPKTMDSQLKNIIFGIIDDRDYYLRSAAVFASVKIADTQTKDAMVLLRKLAEDKDEYVRRDLAQVLGKLTGKAATMTKPLLEKLISDRENIVRREAVLSLRIVAETKTQWVLNLIPRLARDLDESVRENAAYVLGYAARKSPSKTFEAILDFTTDDSQSVMENLAWSLEKVFFTEPNLLFNRMRILQIRKVNPRVLKLTSKYAKSRDIESICGIYSDFSEDMKGTDLENALVSASSVFEVADSLEHAYEVKDLFQTYLFGLRARDINDLALIKFHPKSLSGVYKIDDSKELRNFEVLSTVPEMALRYKQIAGLSDKHIYLGKMLGIVDSALENPQDVSYPETYILNQVLHNFRHVLTQTTDSLKGRADLKVTLRTKKILPQDTVTLLLGLENVGESMAENIKVTLAPSATYRILDKTKTMEMLAHERKDAVEFRIEPNRRKTFRVKFSLSWDDFEMQGKSISFADRVKFIEIPREFRYIPNPYITGGPIKPPSKDMFFGREDVFKFITDNISSHAQKNVLILHGERRTGKTSILYQIPNVLGSKYISVFMDGQEFGGSTMDYFLYKMAKQIAKACQEKGMDIKIPARATFKSDPWYAFKDRFLESLKPALNGKYIVILFDEFEALEHTVTTGRMDPIIFNYIRNLMQHEDSLVFIFAGVHRLEEMMNDYWGVMFNIAMYWKISFLKESETRKLISKPVDGYNMIYDDLALEKIIRATASHPYFVQLICRFLVNRHNSEKRNYITVQDVNEELANVIEKAKPHFDYIWALSSTYERLIMSLLVASKRKRRIVTQKDLLDECERLRLSVDKKEFSHALNNLTAKDILMMVQNGTAHYQFKVDFIRMWVARHKPLSNVILDVEDELS